MLPLQRATAQVHLEPLSVALRLEAQVVEERLERGELGQPGGLVEGCDDRAVHVDRNRTVRIGTGNVGAQPARVNGGDRCGPLPTA